jgi:glycosyltransferase involved in cell wall biosynthesis/GT2 family glycosyltransferase
LPQGLHGRVLRSAGAADATDLACSDVEAVVGRPCAVRGQAFVTGITTGCTAVGSQRGARRLPLDRAPHADGRPVVLILPGLFAVGGVERNTVEVMRALQPAYRFVVATTEPLDPVRGSLHHQLRGLCEGVYDLGEIAAPAAHLELLEQLDARHGFDCVWIVNGSVWLSEHLAGLRQAFADVPIIDQQVYDTTHGWISNYEKPEIRAFDRHVAINRRIADAFTGRFAIPAERVRLIYHAIDDRKWEEVARGPRRDNAVRSGWDVPDGVPLFGCIGRLTDQKLPLDFLDLARRAQADGVPGVFALVGDGELGDSCREFVNRHGLTNVRMPGFVEDPADLLAALDGLVITSAYEGLPIVSLEAMAVGVPILATDVGDLRLVGETHGSITLFAATDPAGRYDNFRHWRADMPRHAARAREAAAGVRAAFGVDVIASRYAALFAEALAVRRPAGGRRPPAADCASVSIVIPTHNRCDLLETVLARYAECMEDLDCEIIVVDDGSTDGTRDVLEHVARGDERIRFTTLPNGGPARARNVGASMARKDVVLFVGDDILPCDDRFLRTHARLHAAQPDEGFAVLGKVVWPTAGPGGVTAVMRHIQGPGAEQFSYAYMLPYSEVDWRHFYTCNVSVKRRLVADWMEDGFSSDFPGAAFEDGEFAYRMEQRPAGLRIYFDPSSRGEHHHVHTVRTFIDRQFTVGMMAAIFVQKHPRAARQLNLQAVSKAMDRHHGSGGSLDVGDLLSVIEGVKSLALLLEARGGLGDAHWHTGFLLALFDMVMVQGFVAGRAAHSGGADAGYEYVLSRFLQRIEPSAALEAVGLSGPIAQLRNHLEAA